MPPTHCPFLLAADILSRVRSLMISRSNCANDSRMCNVSRPREVLVLNSCVTDTKLTPRFSNKDNKRAKSSKQRLSLSTL